MASSTGSHQLTLTAEGDREALITRRVDAPRHIVWEAFTNPRYVPQWLVGPPGWSMPTCEIDLRPGGAWRYVYEKPGSSGMTLSGRYIEVEAPVRLVSTESWGPEWPETLNTMSIEDHGDGTSTMTIRVRYPSTEARDAALRTGSAAGLQAGFVRLDALIGSMIASADGAA